MNGPSPRASTTVQPSGSASPRGPTPAGRTLRGLEVSGCEDLRFLRLHARLLDDAGRSPVARCPSPRPGRRGDDRTRCKATHRPPWMIRERWGRRDHPCRVIRVANSTRTLDPCLLVARSWRGDDVRALRDPRHRDAESAPRRRARGLHDHAGRPRLPAPRGNVDRPSCAARGTAPTAGPAARHPGGSSPRLKRSTVPGSL